MTEVFFASLLLGLFAGLAAGLFGIGGGTIIVPVLVWLFQAHDFAAERVMLSAVATSLASALLTSAASARTHHQLGNIAWQRVSRLAPSLLAGAAAGAVAANHFNPEILRWCFVAYLLYTGVNMIRPQQAKTTIRTGSRCIDYIVGFLIGALSAILGIGGGTMSVPYLAGSGLAMKNAIATSSACAVAIAFSAAASYALLGQDENDAMRGQLGHLYLPAFVGISLTSVLTAPVGAKLAHRLPAKRLKRYFALVLIATALKMTQ
ncbi:sulfite exporter TauE/SafE family protein [Methylomonas sp. SURF-1]|uniref:Probable membrane transporter protein n=1 Tax=Methylomonas aurea TaxID=2952224 RepID=A0ABT1UKZ2_9GAMM|nr:sulfite exporter TauE/SafE family protein [Methylomonas sp. SURF-1]MCQ8182894.1 sulfite exporter TauE/SafE family protein [Methylomonas sp. SURF-1]